MSLTDITNTFFNSDLITQLTIPTLNSDLITTQPPQKKQKTTYDASVRLQIAEYALEHGNAKASREFEAPKSTVSYLVKELLATRKRSEIVRDLPANKGGRPLLLANWDEIVMQFIKALRKNGGIVNRNIVIAAAHGIIAAKDPSLLPENGGHLVLKRSWAYSILKRLNFVKRKGTKAAKKIPMDFEAVKETFLARLSTAIEQHSIPKELCVNMDETGSNYVPVACWTMEEEGAAQVPIAAFEDKRQMTVVLAVSATGYLLPPQLIYDGKTDECHPKNVVFPSDWGSLILNLTGAMRRV
jgi:hypothetical protein